jgi:hypothetical protein
LTCSSTCDAADDDQWRGQLDHLANLILNWTGNHAGVAQASEADVRRLVRERRSFIDELQRDALWLAGQSLAGLLIATAVVKR